MLIKTNLRW